MAVTSKKYAQAECQYCHAIHDKPDMFKHKETVETGHSNSRNMRIFSKDPLKSLSLSNRTYYRQIDVWLCKECNLRRIEKRNQLVIQILLIVGAVAVVFLLMGIFSSLKKKFSPITTNSSETSKPSSFAPASRFTPSQPKTVSTDVEYRHSAT